MQIDRTYPRPAIMLSAAIWLFRRQFSWSLSLRFKKLRVSFRIAVRRNSVLPSQLLTSTFDTCFQADRCEDHRDPAPLSQSQRMPEDEHAE